MALQDIGLSMLKHLSSHRGLTYVPNRTDPLARTNKRSDTNSSTSIHDGNSLPKCQTRRILSETERSLRNLQILIYSRKSVLPPLLLSPSSPSNPITWIQLRTLWQMTQLIMMKPENIRPSMDEQRVDDQTGWVCPLMVSAIEVAPQLT